MKLQFENCFDLVPLAPPPRWLEHFTSVSVPSLSNHNPSSAGAPPGLWPDTSEDHRSSSSTLRHITIHDSNASKTERWSSATLAHWKKQQHREQRVDTDSGSGSNAEFNSLSENQTKPSSGIGFQCKKKELEASWENKQICESSK